MQDESNEMAFSITIDHLSKTILCNQCSLSVEYVFELPFAGSIVVKNY